MEGVYEGLGHDAVRAHDDHNHDHDHDHGHDNMDELAEAIDIDIQSHYKRCIHSFIKLHDFVLKSHEKSASTTSSDIDRQHLFPIDGLSTELGRFRVWAGNTGAHRNGKMSLDHRLREVPDVHIEITDLLEELNSDLAEAYDVVAFGKSRNTEEWEFSLADGEAGESESPMELDTIENNDFVALIIDISHIITCLYKLFIAIRNPPRNKIHKLGSIKIPSIFETWDIQHISNKFPTAPAFLIERLGKANSTRRQLLQYYKNHHDKIARNIHSDHPLTIHTDDLGSEGQRSEAISAALKSHTTVSTIKPKPVVHETGSHGGHSQTSYATSANFSQHRRVTIPPPPDFESAYDGKPFECPYCYSLVTVDNMRAWKQHVFRDLQPYICTQENCQRDLLFDSQHEWYEHELQFHYKEWYCKSCLLVFSSPGLFKEHLREFHGEVANSGDTNFVALVDLCERTRDPPSSCLLCGENVRTDKRRKHLGQHMQEVALFILPNLVDDEDNAPDYQEGDEWQSLSDTSENDQKSLIAPEYPVLHGPGNIYEVGWLENMPLEEQSTSIQDFSGALGDAVPYARQQRGGDFYGSNKLGTDLESSSQYSIPRHPNSPESDGAMDLNSPDAHFADINTISNKSMPEADGNDTEMSSRDSLRFHPQICPECGHSFKYPGNLRAHIETHHQILGSESLQLGQNDGSPLLGDGSIIIASCNYPGCGKKFNSRDNLMKHVETRHLTHYFCPLDGCNHQNFNLFSELWLHMRNTHSYDDKYDESSEDYPASAQTPMKPRDM